MSAVKCKLHPNYKGVRRPKRTAKQPEGCPTCWDYYREHTHDLAEAEKPKRHRNAASIRTKIAQVDSDKLDPSRLKPVYDDISGEYTLMYGRRALYVAPSEDEVYAFMDGLKTGLEFNGKV